MIEVYRNNLNTISKFYPKIGDTIYWKDLDGNMHDDVVVDIEEYPQEPDCDVETNYFTKRTEHGGEFIAESDLILPSSPEVDEYKKKKAKELKKEVLEYISRDDVRSILYERLRESLFEDDTCEMILEVLTSDKKTFF